MGSAGEWRREHLRGVDLEQVPGRRRQHPRLEWEDSGGVGGPREVSVAWRPCVVCSWCWAWPLALGKHGISDSAKVKFGEDPGHPPVAPSPEAPQCGLCCPPAPRDSQTLAQGS